ncbi:MAG: hypothetical protein IH991_24545 [Planctomycetes bacterium]|nr:hypothetical protein [Planctomycetota bacterium]
MDSPKTVAWQDKFEHHVYYGEPIVGLDGKPKSTGSVRLSTPSPSACR